MAISTEILVFVLSFLVAKYIWNNRRYYYLMYKIPWSNFDWKLTSIYKAITAGNEEIFQMAHETFKNIDICMKTFVGYFFVVIFRPEDLKKVINMKECYDKPFFFRFAFLDKGSLFGKFEYWESHRKILNPYFGLQGLRTVIPIFNEKAKILVKNLKEKVDQKEFDVLHYNTALTLETIMKVMEYDYDIQNQERKKRDEPIEYLVKYSQLFVHRVWKVWYHPKFIFNNSRLRTEGEEAMNKGTFKFAYDMLRNIKEKMNNDNNNEDYENDGKKHKTFIRALADPTNGMDDEEIIDEIKTVIIAAQDTSALASSTTLLMLAMHKDIQAKVIDELHRVLGKTLDAPFIDFDKLNELKYLEMVINETMRLYPVVPYIFRTNTVEVDISGGYTIPANSTIVIPIYEIQRSKKYWGEDADEYRPERFSDENISKIDPYTFIPFSKGARMCVGWRYAMFLMKVQLSNVLMRYEVDTSLKMEDLSFSLNVTLNINQGCTIALKERQIVSN